MTTIELLDKLPEEICLPNDHPVDEFDDYICYTFNLIKDEGEYELFYFSHLWDKELVSFCGSLPDVAEKMYAWCMENGYIKDKQDED